LEAFRKNLDQALKAGLFDKILAVRAYAHLFLEINDIESYSRKDRFRFRAMFSKEEFAVREATAIGAPLANGLGYTKEKAEEFIRNRYRRGLPPVRHTIKRLLADPEVRPRLVRLRERGLRDWEIILSVANLAMNYRTDLSKPSSTEEFRRISKEFMNTEEPEGSLPVPNHVFSDEQIDFQLKVNGATMLKTWGLDLHQQTPDFVAVRRFLETRYHILEDDVPHEDLFTEGKCNQHDGRAAKVTTSVD
jgi:hypothetical protein